ncbi:Methylmalonyl-CoA epimerase [Acropora cervicornis]|uniref:Methylmalonyl-CoA epimerase n=1 Tax=Acropora cervicornis TaxID=6130 RepID=A0AAD9QKS5_ACRCE|nr:Methylmalonyl-CoA epimerase [Acropora cervicornis]
MLPLLFLIWDLPEHGVSTVFVNLGNAKLELLYPLGDNSPIEGFLKKKADGGIHHICIEIGAHGKPVVFLHPKDCGGVLVEIEEA